MGRGFVLILRSSEHGSHNIRRGRYSRDLLLPVFRVRRWHVHPLVVLSCDHPVVRALVVGPDRRATLDEHAFQSAARTHREKHVTLPRVWFLRELDAIVNPGLLSLSGGAALLAIAPARRRSPFAIAPLAGHRPLGLVGTAGRSGEAPRSRRDPCGRARLEGKLFPMTH